MRLFSRRARRARHCARRVRVEQYSYGAHDDDGWGGRRSNRN